MGQTTLVGGSARLTHIGAVNSFPRGAPKQPRYGFTNMDDLAKAAQAILQEAADSNNTKRIDNDTRLFITAVKNYAQNASTGGENSARALADLQKTLNGFRQEVRQETSQIREQLSKATSSITSGISQPESLSFWRSLRTQDWQTGIRTAASPLTQSTGTGSSTPGVSHAELGSDCEIVVKIRDSNKREELRKKKAP